MDTLILRILTGDASPSEEEQVRRWRAESPDNEVYYRRTEALWSATAPGLRPAAAPVDPQVIIAEAERRRAGAEDVAAAPDHAPVLSLTRHREEPRTQLPPAVRKVLILAAGVAAVAIAIHEFRREPVLQPVHTSFAAASAPRTVLLDDGSYVRLGAASTIDSRATAMERTVLLTGRAFFAVAHDEARPFVVRAGSAETRVLGTRFEVAETDGEVRTLVLDGRVAVSNALGRVEVEAGSVGRAAEGTEPTTESPAEIYALLDWPGGLLLFQGTPLGRVAEDVARAFGRRVVVETETLQALRISGSFEDESFEQVVEALCDAAGAVCTADADGAVISPRMEP